MKKRGYGCSAGQRCEYCLEAIFSKQFYLFPCGHGFHTDCIMRSLPDYMDSSTVELVVSIEKRLRSLVIRTKDADRRAIIQQESLQNEIDSYIAGECPLCGEVIIKYISKPLISEEDVRHESKLWNL